MTITPQQFLEELTVIQKEDPNTEPEMVDYLQKQRGKTFTILGQEFLCHPDFYKTNNLIFVHKDAPHLGFLVKQEWDDRNRFLYPPTCNRVKETVKIVEQRTWDKY